ncbi:MAG: YicC family protein [Candidatus Marinimicrobia bacterium]|nr:YicC family protein [Candidatus Neomarinimicrobiota bacterium]
MIKSMTGFGKVERELENVTLSVEVRSVNSRYFDFSVNMPEIFKSCEENIKRLFNNKLVRGSVKLTIYLNGQQEQNKVGLNRDQLDHYCELLNQASESLNGNEPVRLDHLLNFSEIFERKPVEFDEEKVNKELFKALEDAVSDLVKMQEKEGENLAIEIKRHLDITHNVILKIKTLSSQLKDEYYKKSKAKLMSFLDDLDIDENRIIQEAAIFSKKIDITEECERLDSHLNQFRSYFDLDEPVGKRMIFLLQEMNREISTIGAKSESAQISHLVVDVKNEFEKIREQAQNIL